MNRFAPPSSDVGPVARTYLLGNAGWVAVLIVVSHASVIAISNPGMLAFFSTNPIAVFFVYFAALTSLLLFLGLLLLLARLPSSILLFAGALTSGLLEFGGLHPSLGFAGVVAALGCLAVSIKVFFRPAPIAALRGEA